MLECVLYATDEEQKEITKISWKKEAAEPKWKWC